MLNFIIQGGHCEQPVGIGGPSVYKSVLQGGGFSLVKHINFYLMNMLAENFLKWHIQGTVSMVKLNWICVGRPVIDRATRLMDWDGRSV